MGGYHGAGYSDVIDYIAIPIAGNATDFGNLSQSRYGAGSTSDGSRAVAGGGRNSSNATTDVMDHIQIGNPVATASDFGDLSQGRQWVTALSGA